MIVVGKESLGFLSLFARSPIESIPPKLGSAYLQMGLSVCI